MQAPVTLIASEGRDIRVTSTPDQREAPVDADFRGSGRDRGGGIDAWANDLVDSCAPWILPCADRRPCSAWAGSCAFFITRRRSPRSPANAVDFAHDPYIFNYTNPAPTEALAMRTAAPSVQVVWPLLVRRAREQPRVARAHRRVKPRGDRHAAGSSTANHCASIQALRLLDGTDAMLLPYVRAPHGAGRQVGSRDLRCASPTAGRTDGVLPAAAAPGEPPSGPPRVSRCATASRPTTWIRACASRSSKVWPGELDGSRRRPGDARRPAGGRRGRGHRRSSTDRGVIVRNGIITRVVIAPNNGAIPEPGRRRRSSRSPRRSTPTASAPSTRARCPRVGGSTCAITSASSSRRQGRVFGRPHLRCTPSCSTRRRRRASTSTGRRRCFAEMLEANRLYLPLFFR